MVATNWSQVPPNCNGWTLNGITPDIEFGGHGVNLLRGKVTLIHKSLTENDVELIKNTMKGWNEDVQPTRIVVIAKENKATEMIKGFIDILVTKNKCITMAENV